MMVSNYLSRKLWLSLLVMAIAAWARSKNYVDGPQFVSLVIAAYGGYTWANVYQKSILEEL